MFKGTKKESRMDDMAQWIKVPATNPDGLFLVPGTHVLEVEN